MWTEYSLKFTSLRLEICFSSLEEPWRKEIQSVAYFWRFWITFCSSWILTSFAHWFRMWSLISCLWIFCSMRVISLIKLSQPIFLECYAKWPKVITIYQLPSLIFIFANCFLAQWLCNGHRLAVLGIGMLIIKLPVTSIRLNLFTNWQNLKIFDRFYYKVKIFVFFLKNRI